jgi:VIT1/CCC1 family predicted Fe2+/Mn2+ transporter
LSRKDALAAHVRDELGISKATRANPIQAALASAASFSIGAAVPLMAGIFSPINYAVVTVYGTSLLFLVVLGALGAEAGGAPMFHGALRVAFWGGFAMAATAAIGLLFHVQM